MKVTENSDGTVTMSNGIVAIVIVKQTGRLNSVIHTRTSDGTTKTSETMLSHGQYYYGGSSLGNGIYRYTLATNPATNGGIYADVGLLSDTATQGVMEIRFSMRRGSPGYYSTAIMTHRKQDAKFEVGVGGRHPGKAGIQRRESALDDTATGTNFYRWLPDGRENLQL